MDVRSVDNSAPVLGTKAVKRWTASVFPPRLRGDATPLCDPGDIVDGADSVLTWDNSGLSTIHSPYYRSLKISLFLNEERRVP